MASIAGPSSQSWINHLWEVSVAMYDRSSALKKVQMYSFGAHEAALYLDSHPDNPKALAYFRKSQQLADQATAAYEESFGPLTYHAGTNTKYWDWVDGPWPWEMEE